jgi:hypothetical protein
MGGTSIARLFLGPPFLVALFGATTAMNTLSGRYRMGLELRTDVESYVNLSVCARIAHWKWWFVLLVILGITAASYAFYQRYRDVQVLREAPKNRAVGEWIDSNWPTQQIKLVADPPAEAAPTSPTSRERPDKLLPEDVRLYIVLGIYALLALTMIVSLGVVLFSSRPTAVTPAADIVKMCLSFFIGAATGYV